MISRITFYKKTSLTQIFLFFFIPSYIYSMEESMTLQPEESQLLQAVSLDHAEGPVVQKSGVWTIFKYGLTKTVAGQTSFSIFQALAENGTLEGDFLEQPTEALNRYNDALIERFEKKDLDDKTNQEKIAFIRKTDTALEEKHSRELELAQILAEKYFQAQKIACKRLIADQAFTIEPALAEERDDAIRRAESKYALQFQQLHERAETAVLNANYLRKKIKGKTIPCQPDDKYIDPNHVQTPQTYLEFIHHLQQEKISK